ESRTQAGELTLTVLDIFDLLDRFGDQIDHGAIVFGHRAAIDVEDVGLGAVHQIRHIALFCVAQLCDPLTDLDQAPQHGFLAHDLGVELDAGPDRHAGYERVQVRRAADLGDLTATL